MKKAFLLFILPVLVSTTGKCEDNISVNKVIYSRDNGIRECAGRLSDYVEKVSGAKFGLAEYDSGKKYNNAFILRLDEALQIPDSFSIKSDRVNVYLSGNNTRGLLFAVNEILEKYYDVRWLTPWDTYIPKKPEVRIEKNISKTYAPAFAYRGYHICHSGKDRNGNIVGHYDEKTLAWMSNNKMNMKFVHNDELPEVKNELERLNIMPFPLGGSYNGFCPVSLFGEHPEYFPLINNKRVGQGVIKRCLSNRGLQEYFAEQIKRYFKKYPDMTMVSIQPTDGLGWCECKDCLAMDTEDDKKNKTVNGRVYAFVNIIAEKIHKEY